MPIWARGDAVPGWDLELRPGVDFEGTLAKPKGMGWERNEVHQISLSDET